MKLLLIEDNTLLLESLKSLLGRHYLVESATTGKDALQKARTNNYDVIVLDLGLPDMNGSAVCDELRKNGNETPVLILTANEAVTSKIQMLNLGADDYLAKPFNTEELLARIQALVRRAVSSGNSSNILEVADLMIDANRRQVSRSKQQIELRRKEFDILEYLVRNRGKVVTRAQIIQNVWDGSKGSWNNTVDVHMKHLRDKVDKPFHEKLIKTAYGVGYIIDDTV